MSPLRNQARRESFRYRNLRLHLTAVTDARYDYDPSGVVDFVNDSIIPSANTERLETGQLLRPGRAGLLGEGH